jgi:hypothetical protein
VTIRSPRFRISFSPSFWQMAQRLNDRMFAPDRRIWMTVGSNA